MFLCFRCSLCPRSVLLHELLCVTRSLSVSLNHAHALHITSSFRESTYKYMLFKCIISLNQHCKSDVLTSDLFKSLPQFTYAYTHSRTVFVELWVGMQKWVTGFFLLGHQITAKRAWILRQEYFYSGYLGPWLKKLKNLCVRELWTDCNTVCSYAFGYIWYSG